VLVPLGPSVKVNEGQFKPGELNQPERIHPFDLYKLLEGKSHQELIELGKHCCHKDEVTVDGKTYIQDINVMPKTQGIR
jgi:hypothetical protein